MFSVFNLLSMKYLFASLAVTEIIARTHITDILYIVVSIYRSIIVASSRMNEGIIE